MFMSVESIRIVMFSAFFFPKRKPNRIRLRNCGVQFLASWRVGCPFLKNNHHKFVVNSKFKHEPALSRVNVQIAWLHRRSCRIPIAHLLQPPIPMAIERLQ